jgi:hypothetical protein
MASLSDLIRLARLYPPGFMDGPVYALAGGSAMQCWLYPSVNDREHHDIDIFAFQPSFLQSQIDPDAFRNAFFLGSFTKSGIVPPLPDHSSPLQIIRGGYFDAEIVPETADVRAVSIEKTHLLALSPELLAVCLFSYPNIHSSTSFQDVLKLNQSGCLQDSSYFSGLLAQTALSKLVSAQDILGLKTERDLQALVDAIHYRLIKRFLHWDQVNVDALNPFQFFVLLDIGEEIFSSPPAVLQCIDNLLKAVPLEGRKLQIVKLGLRLLLSEIPLQNGLLQDPTFLALLRRGLVKAIENPGFWLSRTKNILMTWRQFRQLENLIGTALDFLWTPAVLMKVVQRILFDDPSRLTLLSSVRSICQDLKTGQISKPDCVELIRKLLGERKLISLLFEPLIPADFTDHADCV